jgi:hypothetical protein
MQIQSILPQKRERVVLSHTPAPLPVPRAPSLVSPSGRDLPPFFESEALIQTKSSHSKPGRLRVLYLVLESASQKHRSLEQMSLASPHYKHFGVLRMHVISLRGLG